MSNQRMLTPIGQELDRFYQRSKLERNDGKDCPSYGKCSASCSLEGRTLLPPTGAYVGEEYEASRILFVGINTNWGSDSSEMFYSCYDWISRDGTEPGDYIAISVAIHRIVCKIVGRTGMTAQESRRHFAFTNLVKCSVSTDAARPTMTMRDNCAVRHGYLFEELAILQPRIIVTLGGEPFGAIRSHYIDSVAAVSPLPVGWIFTCDLGGLRAVTLFAYNPGQGYRSPRNAWKRIRETSEVGDDWKPFLPDGVASGELVAYLGQHYKTEDCVDPANPFYEMIVDRLVSAAKSAFHL